MNNDTPEFISKILALISPTPIIKTLNLAKGMIGNCMTSLLQEAIKSETRRDNLHKRSLKGKSMREDFIKGGRKMTTGCLFRHYHVFLDNKVLELQEEKEQKKDAEERARMIKNENIYEKKKLKYKKVMNKKLIQGI